MEKGFRVGMVTGLRLEYYCMKIWSKGNQTKRKQLCHIQFCFQTNNTLSTSMSR
jgi:hypothetical protein